MKVWRSRSRAVMLPALAGAIAVAGPVPAAADFPADYPLIIDVSTPPDGLCNGALRGTTAVYVPPGLPAQSDVEWRILAGEQPIRSGITAVTNDVVTIGFDLRRDELPRDGRLRVDARTRVQGGQAGAYGKPWNFRVTRECGPLHVASIGDSVLWGQGLDLERKFAHLTAEALGAETGRAVQVHDYSQSGALLDAPGTEGAQCAETAADAVADVFCQLHQAADEAGEQGYRLDVVLLDGCMNDLDPFFGIPVGVTPGTEDLTAAVERECGGVGAEATNPAAHVPYFSGATRGYGGRGMRQAIELAHALPGNPKVVVANYFHDGDADTPAGLRERWSEFVRASAEVFRRAATDANAAAPEPYAVAADGLFTEDTGGAGAARKPALNPLGDESFALRLLACPPLGDLPPQCRMPAVSHLSLADARPYADAFLMNPRLREWFGGGGPAGAGFTVSRQAGPPGTTVSFDAAPAGAAIRQYEWYFGDGAHATTQAATVSHVYHGSGPNLPRLVVTDMTGHRSLYELDEPIMID
ncbi:PKD domain-containing protein [Nocardia yamanashiensis]|uniref:PKD domain-containing protein n=1 Tax=Nocardia yamanashiensis TaxID=209247 RepID=UPI000AB08612|nr:PKD domain-containing protein [Nocardia yamanashiensis]